MVPTARSGFTLMELILVLAIVVLLTALSYPSLEGMYSGVQMDAALDSIRGAWAEAQSRAVNESRPYRFSIVAGNGSYRVAPDSADYWNGDSNPPSDDPDNPPLILDGALPKGVSFGPGGSNTVAGELTLGSLQTPSSQAIEAGQWVTTVVFLPTGSARDDAEVTLEAEGSQGVLLKIRGLTGVVTSQRLSDPSLR